MASTSSCCAHRTLATEGISFFFFFFFSVEFPQMT